MLTLPRYCRNTETTNYEQRISGYMILPQSNFFISQTTFICLHDGVKRNCVSFDVLETITNKPLIYWSTENFHKNLVGQYWCLLINTHINPYKKSYRFTVIRLL